MSRSILFHLLFLTVGYVLSLLIYQKGFLQKRHVLPGRSSLRRAVCICTTSGRSACSDVLAHPHCWIRPQFNRSIWLIIDALRYSRSRSCLALQPIFRFDFIAPPAKGAPPNTFYHGQMRKVEAMLREQPDRARLYRFIADAPTTTFQRIKGLTTGSIPAFIEAGENFGGSEILEDNLIDQLLRRDGNVTFMGDDTWLTLFPNRFHRAFDAPSFDVKDLDTVDNVVLGKKLD